MLSTLASILVLLASSLAVAGPPQGSAPPEPPRVPQGDTVNVSYWGTVTELTKDSITIQFPNEKVKPKKFPVSEVLAAGQIPMGVQRIAGQPGGYTVSASEMYRLTDVKVGDWVLIGYSRVGGIDTCNHLCIQKRPGGRVPPLPDEAEALRKHKRYPGEPEPVHIRYDEWTNAYWDLEDHGTAYPEKFGKSRRFPVAPMPREVKAGPPSTP
ncbi:MAG: hypothetical protein J0I06_18070 [Planctomycetes bacterium]|nr:hypothetical protein [Planctomycetota bacterium]